MSKTKANVMFSINVNLLKFVFMNCSGEILNLEYSGATFWCVLGMRILLFFLFLSLEALCRTQKEQQLEEMSGFGKQKKQFCMKTT